MNFQIANPTVAVSLLLVFLTSFPLIGFLLYQRFPKKLWAGLSLLALLVVYIAIGYELFEEGILDTQLLSHFYSIKAEEQKPTFTTIYPLGPAKDLSVESIDQLQLVTEPCVLTPGSTKAQLRIVPRGQDAGRPMPAETSAWRRFSNEKELNTFRDKVIVLAAVLGKPLIVQQH